MKKLPPNAIVSDEPFVDYDTRYKALYNFSKKNKCKIKEDK